MLTKLRLVCCITSVVSTIAAIIHADLWYQAAGWSLTAGLLWIENIVLRNKLNNQKAREARIIMGLMDSEIRAEWLKEKLKDE